MIGFASSISSRGFSSSSSILGTTLDDEDEGSSSLSGVTTVSVVNSGDELEAVEVYVLDTVLSRRSSDFGSRRGLESIE